MKKPGTRDGWPVRIGAGCLVLLVAGAIVLAVVWVGMMSLNRRAVDTRQALDENYPSQETFTPTPEGSIPPERMERFLAVRRTLLPYCETFSAHRAVFRRMEGYEEAEEEPETGEFLRSVGAVTSTLWRVGRDVGRYAIARNQALLENDMGLGEYTWIYVITYFSWLGNRPADFVAQNKPHAKVFHGRVLGEVEDMIERHVTDLETALETSAGSASPGLRDKLVSWQAELDALERDHGRVPFQDGLPSELETSLERFREELERVYCPATGELDIMQTVDTGIWYDHR